MGFYDRPTTRILRRREWVPSGKAGSRNGDNNGNGNGGGNNGGGNNGGGGNPSPPGGGGPKLTSPTGTATSDTTADLSVTTNRGNGTLYWVVTISSTKPTKAQVKAGQNEAGAAAPDSGSQAVSATGAQAITGGATGLTAETAYFAHFMHEAANGSQSAVATSSTFTTEAGGDADFSSVKLLLDPQGTDGSTTFTDLSSSAHELTADGAQIDTAQFKFGTSSALFDGTDDWLSAGESTDFDQGTAFTHEGWFMFNSTAGDQVLFTNGAVPASGGSFLRYTGGSLDWFNWDTTGHFSNAWSPSTGVWYHVAICRDGTTTRMFIDGTALATTSTASQVQEGQAFYGIGGQGAGSRPFNGWCGGFRWTKDVGRYTSNFTPPTEAFPTS